MDADVGHLSFDDADDAIFDNAEAVLALSFGVGGPFVFVVFHDLDP